MPTRRKFLRNSLTTGAYIGLGLPGVRLASAQDTTDEEARNKDVVRRFKESQGTDEYEQVLAEVMSPDYQRLRGGFENLATNAAGSELAESAQPVRTAFPDRTDTTDLMIADGDMVGMRFRVQGTHEGNFFGIPATGKTIDITEVGAFRLEDGRIVEAWYMADEVELLKQLGVGLPSRQDGQRIVPVPARQSRPGQATLEEILAAPVDSQTYRNKVVVSAYKSEFPPPGVLPDRPGRPYDVYLRGGFKHFVDYGNANGLSDQGIGQAFPDRQDKVDFVLAEGDTVWIQFRLSGTHGRSLFGIPPTNRHIEAAEVGIMTFDGTRWDTGWFFGDDLGMALQLGVPDLFTS